jgi:dTDP-glucose 4,6-dehydratase
MRRILLTGGAGFIGSQLARDLVQAGAEVVVLDKLTYAGRRENLAGVGCTLVVADVCDPEAVRGAMRGCDAVVHAAAESHVTRSLGAAADFLRTNIEGTRVVLDAALEAGIRRVLHVSTDEVFGEVADGVACEVDAPLRPGNPYAASKVGAEALVHAWRHTHGLPTTIVRCTNNYGPRQHPEKAIPCWTRAALAGGPLPIDGDGSAVRDWLHVEDFSRGVLAALRGWRDGATWHFAGWQHRTNQQMAEAVAAAAGAPAVFRRRPERQGQDRRYALADAATRAALGWAPRVPLADGVARTVAWYRANPGAWA